MENVNIHVQRNAMLWNIFQGYIKSTHFLVVGKWVELSLIESELGVPRKFQIRKIWVWYGHQFRVRQFTTGFKSSLFPKYGRYCVMMRLVPPSTNQYRPIVTHYRQVLTSITFFWPSTIIYQPDPLHTIIYEPAPPYADPVPPSTNQYHPILTQYHRVPNSTAPHGYPLPLSKYQPLLHTILS